MSDDTPPQPDRIEGTLHPRETRILAGQGAAERAFLDAHSTGRLHHAWLLTGPAGIGKATLAWRVARYLLTAGQPDSPSESLAVEPDSPVGRRIAALSEPGLFLLRRAWDAERKRLKTVITVDEVRRLKSFFSLSAGGEGRRVAIVDSADEMNTSAANALLKLLEEPPAGAVLLLVSHRPARLLPTIRSRCRELRLAPLGADDIAAALTAAGADPGRNAPALAALSGGSAGAAAQLLTMGGLELYRDIVALFAAAPGIDRPAALGIADRAGERRGEARFDLTLTLLERFLGRLARTGVTGPPAPEAAPDEAAALARLSPGPAAARGWATLAETLGNRARQGRAVNLDPSTLILDTLLAIDARAADPAALEAER